MLAVTNYSQDYIDACRSRFAAQVAAFRKLTSGRATKAFEPEFFNDLVLLLDYSFVHRTRALETKDGNPLNEVRVLCTSLLTNDGVMLADKTIKRKPEATVLKYAVGDRIAVGEEDFSVLAEAFFAELERKFGPPS
jgi:hypothetical protein